MTNYSLQFKIDIGKPESKVPATVVMPVNTVAEAMKHMRMVKRTLLKWPYDFALHDEAGIFIRNLK